MVANREVHCLLIDNGNSTDAMYYQLFEKLQILRESVILFDEDLVGFSNHSITLLEYLKFRITFGGHPLAKTVIV